MTEERIFDGRNMTQSELDMMRRIINEVNVEVDIEDGDIVIQAVCDDDHVEQIGPRGRSLGRWVAITRRRQARVHCRLLFAIERLHDG